MDQKPDNNNVGFGNTGRIIKYIKGVSYRTIISRMYQYETNMASDRAFIRGSVLLLLGG